MTCLNKIKRTRPYYLPVIREEEFVALQRVCLNLARPISVDLSPRGIQLR